jgi:very-short-patch-repair endonuclease
MSYTSDTEDNLYEKKEERRHLRKFGTAAEAVLWKMISRRQILNTRFRRQYSIGPYIMDFYCPECRLCIELDGQQHFTTEGETHDLQRSDYLQECHQIKIIRFENNLVFSYPEGIIQSIKDAIEERREEVEEKE